MKTHLLVLVITSSYIIGVYNERFSAGDSGFNPTSIDFIAMFALFALFVLSSSARTDKEDGKA